MSPCHDIQPLVAARPLGVLDPHEEAGVSAHLERCGDCQALLGQVEAALAATVPPAEPAPAGAWAGIEAGLQSSAATSGPARHAPIVLAAAALVTIGWLVAGPGPGAALPGTSQAPTAPAPLTPVEAPPAPEETTDPQTDAHDHGPGAVEPAPDGQPAPEGEPDPATLSEHAAQPAAERDRREPGRAPAAQPRLPARVADPGEMPPGGAPAATLVPPAPEDDLAQVRALMARGDHVQAVAALDRVLALDPMQARAYLLRARCRLTLGDTPSALVDCIRALELDPSQLEAWLLYARTLRQLGRLREAMAAAERALALHPGLAEAWAERGDLREALGDPAGARADLERAAELGHTGAQIELAARLLEEGSADERARELLRRAEAELAEDDPRRVEVEALLEHPRLRH